MNREEFESILEEAFLEGQYQAEIDCYEEAMEIELDNMFNSYNEAGSIPSPSELIKTIKEKIFNHPRVKKFFKDHPEEEAKKKRFIDKYANSAKALYKKDVNFAIGTSIISFLVTCGVMLTVVPFASLPSGLPGIIISGGIGAIIGLIENGLSTKFILSKLKSAEGKAVRNKYEKSVKKNDPGLIGRVIARNAALDDFYKKSYKEDTFDLEDEMNSYNENMYSYTKNDVRKQIDKLKQNGYPSSNKIREIIARNAYYDNKEREKDSNKERRFYKEKYINTNDKTKEKLYGGLAKSFYDDERKHFKAANRMFNAGNRYFRKNLREK